MLTQKEKDLVIEAKLLWQSQVANKFIEGHTARANGFKPIWDDGTYINEDGTSGCPLCKEYLKKDGNCNRCLFVRKFGTICNNLGCLSFCKNPTLETCNIFINNIEKLLES